MTKNCAFKTLHGPQIVDWKRTKLTTNDATPERTFFSRQTSLLWSSLYFEVYLGDMAQCYISSRCYSTTIGGFRNKSHDGRIKCPICGRGIGQPPFFLDCLEADQSDAAFYASLVALVREVANETNKARLQKLRKQACRSKALRNCDDRTCYFIEYGYRDYPKKISIHAIASLCARCNTSCFTERNNNAAHIHSSEMFLTHCLDTLHYDSLAWIIRLSLMRVLLWYQLNILLFVSREHCSCLFYHHI
jgi:hypothetical protein